MSISAYDPNYTLRRDGKWLCHFPGAGTEFLYRKAKFILGKYDHVDDKLDHTHSSEEVGIPDVRKVIFTADQVKNATFACGHVGGGFWDIEIGGRPFTAPEGTVVTLHETTGKISLTFDSTTFVDANEVAPE